MDETNRLRSQATDDDIACNRAAGTRGVLLPTYDDGVEQVDRLAKDQKKLLRTKFMNEWEPVPNTARLDIMSLYRHGIDADICRSNPAWIVSRIHRWNGSVLS